MTELGAIEVASDEAKVDSLGLYDFIQAFFIARHGIHVEQSGVLCDLVRAAMERFSSRRWISVDDALPEHGQRVLVFGNDNGDRFYLADDFRVCGSYDAEYKSWRVDEDTCSYPVVTHWMALPPEPKP